MTISTLFGRHKVHESVVILILNGQNNRCMKTVKYVECIFTCIVSGNGVFIANVCARISRIVSRGAAAYGVCVCYECYDFCGLDIVLYLIYPAFNIFGGTEDILVLNILAVFCS